MTLQLRVGAGMMLVVGLLAGCGVATPPATPPVTPAATASALPRPTVDATPGVSATEPSTPVQPLQTPAASPLPTDAPRSATPGAELALWRTAQLTDVRSGETFSVEALSGRVVVLEMMAVWCHNCLTQQKAAREALARLNGAEVTYMSVGVDPGENAADLARYANENDFGWHFVIASREVARSLVEEFGAEILSPPSVPTLSVGRGGEAELHFGHRGADELHADLTTLLS